MTGKLTGKVALVTGASSGIGEATALALVSEGARVAIVARRSDRLEALVKLIQQNGGEALPIIADITDDEQAHQAIIKANQQLGRLDILVNNAGVMLLSPVLESNTKDWRNMINTNLLGLMYTTHAALPLMKAQGSGHIINISSTAGRFANPSAAVYSATKFGVVAFSEALRREVYKDKIRVTIIEPGLVDTELSDHIPNAETKKQTEAWKKSVQQLTSEDIAVGILYAVTQPAHVNVNEILIRPTDQER